MQVRWTLTAKLVATGLTFLLLALGSIGLTLWVTWNLQGSAAAVNEAGRLRMQTYRLALAVTGTADPLEFAALSRGFDQGIELLQAGDPSRPLLVPWSGDSRHQFEALRSRWTQLRGGWESGTAAGTPATTREADEFVALIDGFVSGIEAEIGRWTAILNMFQLAMMALAIASAVTLMYTSYLLVLSPVARLKRALAAIQQGDLATRVEAGVQDEFGELAAGFNEMARTLQALYASLEEKVRDKTASLEVERQRLADLYQVSDFLGKAKSLDALAGGFATQVRRIAGADAAAVRWSGQANERYLLLAADGLSDHMLRDEACLETGACHCGQLQARAATRVIPIDSATPAPLHHCRNEGYATLVSVPVMLHGSVLGEVDLFFCQPVQLSQEERSLLDSLASHLASAMESLRAEALGREAAVAQERGMLARELHDSIAQSLAFMKIQVQLLREAVRRGDPDAVGNIIGELDTGVRESYSDVRELLVHFRTRTSEEDIALALRSTLSKFEHQSGVPARLELEGHGLPLAPDVQVQVLHVIQEALSNVRKHAHASQVVLRVTASPAWRFEVRDDGVGFNAADRGVGELHVGLRIMSERAARIGASVAVTSRPGGGCAVAVTLPQPAQSTQRPPMEQLAAMAA
ncbi:MAG: type IV pili methyl-accepting chemotaxis transducer N-terminal domain-containing protein [Ramlibacter sp.]|nr:type IV pili methyl-accepting chemotaxis transducer N-terminal domain-containing protein [Ramlibacter sp.]